MTIVLPHGVLFRGGEEEKIRRNLVERNHIDAIIGLPANIFYGTGIPTIIMVLRQKRENTDTLIIDASKGFIKEGKNNKLRACDIRKIVDTVIKRVDVPKYARRVSKEEIRKNEYNLNIPRYVDSSEPTESWDVYASMFGGIPEEELNALSSYWNVFPSLKQDLFTTDGKCSHIKVDDLKSTILANADVQKYLKEYNTIFIDYPKELSKKLIDHAQTLSIVKTEDEITQNLFEKLDSVPLIDKYEAYEIFYTAFTSISGDLESIQTEGIKAIRQVDPNMVIKKKNNKDHEIQEGWKGHILPFALVQEELLKEDLNQIQQKQQELNEIPSEYDEILESFSEDDKEVISNALTEENDAFVLKNVQSTIKTLKKEDDSEYNNLIQQLQRVNALNIKEKQLKKEIKNDANALHLKTKETIENLSDDQLITLLQAKWIQPIIEGIEALPNRQIDMLQKAIESLQKKYNDTFEDIEKEIRETEKQLSQMMSELQGSEEDMAGINEFRKLLRGDF